jgi:hypothetical protein
MNKIGKGLLTWIYLLLFITYPFSTYADTWRVLPADSGRAQWQNDGGYCGALAIQKIMLKYGIWISQQEARSAGGGELLLGENYAQALDNLGIDHITYIDLQANAATHLQRIRDAVRSGNDYIIGARTNFTWGYHTTYDHIFAVHAMSGSSSGFDENNYIYFNDSYPVGSGIPDLAEQYCTWESFSSANNGCGYFFDDAGQWGEQITGISGWSGKVALSVDLNKEPSISTVSGFNMRGNLHLTGLSAGKRYTIKQWQGSWLNFAGFSSGFADLHSFTANSSIYNYRVTWESDKVAIFDLVEFDDTQDANNQQTWHDQTIGNHEWNHYSIYLPRGTIQLSVETSGGTGDADLYLKKDTSPTRSDFDCRSWDYGNTETCVTVNPAAGLWHIGVYGYSAAKDLTVSVEHSNSPYNMNDSKTWPE